MLALIRVTRIAQKSSNASTGRIEFWAQPKWSHPLRPLHSSKQETALMKSEIHKLLEKQAISVLKSPYNQSFLSRTFLVLRTRFSKASNNFASAKAICNLGAFQDGEHPSSRELNPGGRLADNNGSKRCLFLHSNLQRASSLVTLPVAGTSVWVSVPSIWPILSPTRVHQNNTPNSGMAKTTGDKNGGIHRRFSSVSPLQGSSYSSPVNGEGSLVAWYWDVYYHPRNA